MKPILIHELVHHAGGNECAAYSIQVKWMKEKKWDLRNFERIRDWKCRINE